MNTKIILNSILCGLINVAHISFAMDLVPSQTTLQASKKANKFHNSNVEIYRPNPNGLYNQIDSGKIGEDRTIGIDQQGALSVSKQGEYSLLLYATKVTIKPHLTDEQFLSLQQKPFQHNKHNIVKHNDQYIEIVAITNNHVQATTAPEIQSITPKQERAPQNPKKLTINKKPAVYDSSDESTEDSRSEAQIQFHFNSDDLPSPATIEEDCCIYTHIASPHNATIDTKNGIETIYLSPEQLSIIDSCTQQFILQHENNYYRIIRKCLSNTELPLEPNTQLPHITEKIQPDSSQQKHTPQDTKKPTVTPIYKKPAVIGGISVIALLAYLCYNHPEFFSVEWLTQMFKNFQLNR